jgi:hypothetical protein
LKNSLATKDQDITDLKKIVANKSAITPNLSTAPATPEQEKALSDEEARIRQILGLPITNK